MAASFGYTDEEIDRMPLDRASEKLDYLRRHPPLHLLAAAWMGWSPPEDPVPGAAAGGLPQGTGGLPDAPACLSPLMI